MYLLNKCPFPSVDDLGLPDLIMAGKVTSWNKLRRLDMDESLKAFLERGVRLGWKRQKGIVDLFIF